MPYISTDEIKEIRKQIKSTFPKFKFSVVRDHFSEIRVSIISGPIDFGEHTLRSVNHYHIESHYSDNIPAKDFLLKLTEILTKNNKILYCDSDYGSIPNYYVNIRIGKDYDIPYVKI